MKIYRTCRICKAVYYNKSWHHGDKVKLENLKHSRFAWTTRCPACKMIESKSHEGQITITNVPGVASRELFYLITGFAQREYEKNCQRRVIAIVKDTPKIWRITTTDSEMAENLARRISVAFDHVEVKTQSRGSAKQFLKFNVEFLPLFYHRFNFEKDL